MSRLIVEILEVVRSRHDLIDTSPSAPSLGRTPEPRLWPPELATFICWRMEFLFPAFMGTLLVWPALFEMLFFRCFCFGPPCRLGRRRSQPCLPGVGWLLASQPTSSCADSK